MPPANRSARNSANWFPFLVTCLTNINLVVCIAQVVFDITCYWLITSDPDQSDEDGNLNSSALSGTILLLIHLFVIVAQLYFGYCLVDSVKQRDFIACRQWFMTAINIYGIEFLCFILFAFLAPKYDFYVGFLTISILYKSIQLWPIDGFIVNLETYSDPLLGEDEFTNL